MRLIKILLIFQLGIFFLMPNLSLAASKIEIYFFYSTACPHCKNVEPALDALMEKYPEVSLQKFEVYQNAENRKLFQKLSSIFGEPIQSVPTMIINNQVYIGDSQATLNAIENDILTCKSSSCIAPSETISAWEKAHPDAEAESQQKVLWSVLGFIGFCVIGWLIYYIIRKFLHGRRNN